MVIRTQEAQHSIWPMIFGGVFERFPELRSSRPKTTSRGFRISSSARDKYYRSFPGRATGLCYRSSPVSISAARSLPLLSTIRLGR